jgi:predicted nucleotidyltransferase
MSERNAALIRLCEKYGIEILYAFGSRGREVAVWLTGGAALAPGPSDVDLAVKPARPLEVFDKARLAVALEDLLGVNRVDLVMLPEAGAFLAANAIRGERLYARDEHQADEYDLYVLRRAGDLAHWERERQALILGRRA